MYSKVKVNNGSVVIYYGSKGEMRFPTGVTISKQKDKKGKFTDFDEKRQELRSHVQNYQKLNKIIKEWLNRANAVVDDYLSRGLPRPTAGELKKTLENWQENRAYTLNTIFLEAYDEFYQVKRAALISSKKKSEESFKTYGTFRSTIEDFQVEKQMTLVLEDVFTKKWLESFDSWLQEKRPKSIELVDGIYYFKTLGGAKERTRDKRFEVLRSFVLYLIENGRPELSDFLNVLIRYRKENITITEKIKTTLTIEEIHALYKIQLEDSSRGRVVKLFLFACLTGFRWKDIEKFDKEFINFQDGKPVYEFISNKTKNKVGKVAKVPLCKMAMDILESLDYRLNFIRNATANEYIKLACRDSGLFNKLTLATDEKGRKMKRWETITMHRGRDTFITNLIGTVPLHELMVYTNHEKLSTLQGYIDKSRPVNPKYVDIFDKP